MCKFGLKFSEYLRETRRLALFGIFAGYVFLAFHLLSTWVIHGSPSGWDPLVSGFSGIVRNITALLFFYPAVACLANLIAGVLATLVTGFTRLDERGRFRVGVIVVAGISFALLGIPVDPGEMFVHIQTLLGYLIKLLLGAGFVWAALRWRRLGRVLSTAAGFTLGGVFLLWLLLVFAFPWNFSPGDPKDDEPPGPNILIVLSDAQRADVDSLYGGHVPTPNLERLAARGVTYENCFAPSSWTVPSVAAMFTGLAPEVSGMDGIRALPSTIEYLPKRLSEYGYRTWTSIGNSVLSRGIGFYRGFDYFAIYDWNFFGQGLLFDNWSSLYGNLTQRFCIFLNSLLHSYTGRLCPGEGLEMVRELNPAGGDFVYIHIMDPHRPYQPPERYLSNTDYEGRYREDSLGFTRRCDELTEGDIAQLKRLYEGEIRYVDEHVGRVLDILDERGLWTNTAVIFCADHGEEFAEHGRFTHKTANLHHELTHVPLVVYWPGRFEDGSRVSTPVSLCDVYPTLLEGLGLDYDAGMYNGLSLFKARGLNPLSSLDRPVFAQRLWDLPPEPANSDFVVRGEAALFIDYEDGREELYTDYENHPVDVSLGNEELVAELKVLLADWHVGNRELMEYYGTTSPAEPEDRTQIEKLRALGYLQ